MLVRMTRRPAQGADGRSKNLHEGDRRRVDHDHFALAGADQPGDLVAGLLRQGHPAFPTADETRTPLLAGDFGETAGHRARQGPERIAVEIDDPLRDQEALSDIRERVVAIERLAARPGRDVGRCHRTDLTSHRTGKKRSPSVDSRYATPRLPPVPVRRPISRAAINP